MTRVRILRAEPNSASAYSSQYVSTADVSEETAKIFEDYTKGRITLDVALDEIERLSKEERTTVPFSVYLNIHQWHASIYFIQTDLYNRTDGTPKETSQLAQMPRGLSVFFKQNNFVIINPTPFRRVDLYTENDGIDYEIAMHDGRLKPGKYDMFKCYEVIGINDCDIEWAYLMASQDWYDTATNNCLSFSKRIIIELHKQITNGDDLTPNELKPLQDQHFSSKAETLFDGIQFRLSSFVHPRLLPILLLVVVLAIIIGYIELRLHTFKQ